MYTEIHQTVEYEDYNHAVVGDYISTIKTTFY